MATNIRGGKRYMAAIAALKARGEVQYCWRQKHPDCPRVLYASAPKGHRNSITLGHMYSYDEHPELFWESSLHQPECMKCNYSNGAEITNRKRAGKTNTGSYRNPNY